MPNEYDVGHLYHEATEKESDYARAKIYAEKGGDLVARDPMLRKTLGSSSETMRFNFTGRIVKAHISRLLLGDIKAPTDISTFLADTRWAVQAKTHINDLCTYGDAYMLVWPYDEGILTRAVDPISTKLIYDKEDDAPLVGVRHWCERYDNKKATRVNLYDEFELQRWISFDQKVWTPYEDDSGDSVIRHDLGEVPIFHSRTSLPYGDPVHLEAYGAQDMIMRLIIAHGAAIDFMGWPQIYALYEMSTAGGTSDLGDTRAADESADDRTEVTRLRRDPGSIWALRAKEIGQLTPAQAADFLDSLREYRGMASALAGTPERFFNAPGGQQPSADSQRTADSDFRQKVSELQEELTNTFQNTLGCALNLDADKIEVPWRPEEIAGDESFWNTALRKQEAGVSLPQTLIEGGYTPEQVDEFVTEGRGDDMIMLRRVEILDKLADAIGKMGAATATGAIDKDRINTLIDGIIGGS